MTIAHEDPLALAAETQPPLSAEDLALLRAHYGAASDAHMKGSKEHVAGPAGIETLVG